MIKTFCDKRTEDVFNGRKVQRLDAILTKKARRRLELLNGAVKIEDLYFPPSNKFHVIQGYQPPRYAISVNAQWRITFEWQDGDALQVCLEDYH